MIEKDKQEHKKLIREDLRKNLITVNPKSKTKGFKDEFFFSKKELENEHDYVRNLLFDITRNINSYNLSQKDKKIIDNISKTYSKLSLNNELDEDDFYLKKHENIEIKKISKKNLVRYLVYRYKFNLFPKLKKIDDYPPCVQIEPTSVCNFRCLMCYQADKSFSNKSNGFMGNMSMEVFKKAIDELEGNVEAITFASRGEPTLNKLFPEMLEYTNNKFLGLKLNTNASLLNEKLIHTILSSSLQTIVFSIDEKDKESYEKIRINGKFEKVIKNLELFNEIREKHYKREDKIVRISGVKLNDNQDIDLMKKKWGNIADIIAFTNYIPWESSYENPENGINKPCSELWSRMFIWQDGKVNPCDFDYKSILSKWNIKDKSIKEIWNSEEYNYLRYAHLNSLRKKIEPCKRCIAN